MSGAEVIDGDHALPIGYPHPHASEEARRIAERGMILRVQVGSGVHGISIDGGNDDRDEMGVCLEPPEFVTGLARVPNGIDGEGPSVEFEQYERHTAWDRNGGVAERSGAGDLDVIIYSAQVVSPGFGWESHGADPPVRARRRNHGAHPRGLRTGRQRAPLRVEAGR